MPKSKGRRIKLIPSEPRMLVAINVNVYNNLSSYAKKHNTTMVALATKIIKDYLDSHDNK